MQYQLYPYLGDSGVLDCPAHPGTLSLGSAYGYNRFLSWHGSMKHTANEDKPTYRIVAGDGRSVYWDNYEDFPRMDVRRHNEGINLLFVDGHAKWHRPESFVKEPDRLLPGRNMWRRQNQDYMPSAF